MILRLIKGVIDILFTLTLALCIFLGVREYLVQPFQVEGHSMDLTLKDGNQMLLFKQGEPERFDIIVFPDPMGSGNSYVKRLIGVPGDQLSVKDDQLILNGIVMDEPYLEPLKSQQQTLFTKDFSLWDTLGIEIIPEGYYFVMGDNRPSSGDSRQFGLVPIDSVEGKTNLIYFPFSQMQRLPNYTIDNNGVIVREE